MTNSRLWCLLVLASLAALTATACENECMCASAGGSTFARTDLHAFDDQVYLSGSVRWAPCCGDVEQEERTWRIDLSTGVGVKDALPAGATPLEGVDEDGTLRVIHEASGTTLLVEALVEQALSIEIEVGEIIDTAGGDSIAPLRVDSAMD